MKAVNLHLLTRIHDPEMVSMLLQALSGCNETRNVSPHEAATLWSLADSLAVHLRGNVPDITPDVSLQHMEKQPRAETDPAAGNWISYLDGFYFSYTIQNIGKEFDLLKISTDGECVLNIELKSELIEEERIKKQLEQNRYYLSHIAHTIYSFTYVMETDEFYSMNSKGHLRKCSAAETAEVLMRDTLQDYLADGIDRFFQAERYLISPVASPDQFLQEKYFLTNQQFDFKRRILECLQSCEASGQAEAPVISISGIAGCGKTLLLLDLAMHLSQKQQVLFIHSGPLRRGHLIINERLRNVSIISGEHLLPEAKINGKNGNTCAAAPANADYVMIDEADHLEPDVLSSLLKQARAGSIPVIMTYDPHHLLLENQERLTMEEPSGESAGETLSETSCVIEQASSLSLAFTGHIRINRPVYSFLRTLLHLKDHPGNPDYSCIEVLYAGSRQEQDQISAYFRSRGYQLISHTGGTQAEEELIAQEYNKVLMILDDDFYYDETFHLRIRNDETQGIRLIYEGLSRTRENLCLLVTGSRELFTSILSIKLHR